MPNFQNIDKPDFSSGTAQLGNTRVIRNGNSYSDGFVRPSGMIVDHGGGNNEQAKANLFARTPGLDGQYSPQNYQHAIELQKHNPLPAPPVTVMKPAMSPIGAQLGATPLASKLPEIGVTMGALPPDQEAAKQSAEIDAQMLAQSRGYSVGSMPNPYITVKKPPLATSGGTLGYVSPTGFDGRRPWESDEQAALRGV